MIDKVLDKIYDDCDNLLLDSKFDALSQNLQKIDISKTNTDELLGYLTVTLAAKTKISYREQFFNDVKSELQNRGYYKDMLKGLQ